MIRRLYLTDKEVANIMSIHPMTISRVFRNTGKYSKEDVLRLAKPEKVGDMRRWNVHKLAAALGISEEELYSRI